MKKLFSSIILSILFVSMVFCQTPTTKNINTMSQTNINTNPTGKIPVTTGTNQTGYTTPQAISDFVNSNIVSPNYVSNSRLNDSLTAIKNTMNGIITANFGNVAYVSKSGNNSTAVIGDRNRPFKDPIAARKAIESQNINNATIEILPATYLVCDTDTANYQMSVSNIVPDVFVLVNATQAQNKKDWTLSPQNVKTVNYYIHAGVRLITKRFNDSFPTPLFFDTVGNNTLVFGNGSFEDYGSYRTTNSLNGANNNNNYAYSCGRIWELRKDANVYMKCFKIHVVDMGLYQYGGLRTSSYSNNSENTRIWNAIDSVERNHDFRSLVVYVDSITGINFPIGMNYLNNSHLSDRSGKTRGIVYLKALSANTTGGGWMAFESWRNYDITLDCDFWSSQGVDLLNVRNSNLNIFSKNAKLRGTGFWCYGNFDSLNLNIRLERSTTTHAFAQYNLSALTKNARVTIEAQNHIQNPAGAWGGGNNNLSFMEINGGTDTTNFVVIQNTNNAQMYPYGSVTAPMVHIKGNSYWHNGTTPQKVIIRNSSFYAIGGTAPIVQYSKSATSAADCPVVFQNVIGNGTGLVGSGGTLSAKISTPITSNDFKPY